MAKTIVTSISYPSEMQEFLDENPDLSLSKMLQSKIIEIRENRRIKFAETDRLKKTILMLNNRLTEAGDKIAELEKEHGK